MASTINSSTSNGIVITPDTSGEIELQANGVTKAKVTANGLQDANGASLRGGSFRNLVINGDMRIDQRNAGSAITSHAGFAVDRYKLLTTAGGSVSLQQSTDAPEDASYSLKFTVVTGATPSSGVTGITQSIEGNNVAHLKLGTANAKTVTLSFWVKASVTGTYSMSLMNGAVNRFYIHVPLGPFQLRQEGRALPVRARRHRGPRARRRVRGPAQRRLRGQPLPLAG